MWGLLAAAILASPAPQEQGLVGFFDGAGLVQACMATDANAAARKPVCLGYIAGAVDQLMMQQTRAGPGGRTICPPAALTLETFTSAVLDRASWAASGRGVSAASFVKLALEDAFPCRRDADIM